MFQGINHPDLKAVEIPIPIELQDMVADGYLMARQKRLESVALSKEAINRIDLIFANQGPTVNKES